MASEKRAACSSDSNVDDDTESRNSDKDEELDFFSPNFNPRRALLTSNVNVPFKNIKTFESVQNYEDALKRRQTQRSCPAPDNQSSSRSRSRPSAGRPVASSSKSTSSGTRFSDDREAKDNRHNPTKDKTYNYGNERPKMSVSQSQYERRDDRMSAFQEGRDERKSASQEGRDERKSASQEGRDERMFAYHERKDDNTPSTSRLRVKQGSRDEKNVLSRMTKMSGPLQLLTKCAEERLYVRVMTRGATLVRSICRGYIVAFDKHFNMALIDVDEVYRRPAVLGKVRSRRSHKLQSAQKLLQEERVEQAQQKLQAFAFREGSEELSSLESTVKEDKSSQHFTQTGVKKDCTQKTSSDDGSKQSLSSLERDALFLGIADENVEHRHVNQLLIRGENVVLISIVNE